MKTQINNIQSKERISAKLHAILVAAIIGALLFGLASSSSAQAKSDSIKCAGIKANGIACQSTWIQDNGFCRVHNPDRIACSGVTVKGIQCKAIVSHAGDLCGIHAKLSAKDLVLFPNYKKADKEYGQDNRFSDQWCELAAKVN